VVLRYECFDLEIGHAHFYTQGFGFVASRYGTAIVIGEHHHGPSV